MDNQLHLLQSYFNKSNKLLTQKKYKESKSLLLKIVENIEPGEIKNNTFLLFNLGLCDLYLDNINQCLNSFMTIYEYYQTNKSLSIMYVPHLETIFNDPKNYDLDGNFKFYSKKFDNVDLIYTNLINFCN